MWWWIIQQHNKVQQTHLHIVGIYCKGIYNYSQQMDPWGIRSPQMRVQRNQAIGWPYPRPSPDCRESQRNQKHQWHRIPITRPASQTSEVTALSPRPQTATNALHGTCSEATFPVRRQYWSCPTCQTLIFTVLVVSSHPFKSFLEYICGHTLSYSERMK